MKAKTDSRDYLERQYAYEQAFHKDILAETDPSRRRNLYIKGYEDAYRGSETFSPGETDFGYQGAEVAMLAPLLAGKRVVDYGAGYGSSTLHLARYAAHVTGCDILPAVVTRALERTAGTANADFMLVEPAGFPFAPGSADVVYASDVIEHLHPDDALGLVRAVHQSLRPGGWFVCITPHPVYGPSDISRHFVARGGPAEGFHLKEYTYGELSALLRQAGFGTLLTPLLSPRHLAKAPGLTKLCLGPAAWRTALEGCGTVMGTHWLRKALGFNRAVYVLARK